MVNIGDTLQNRYRVIRRLSISTLSETWQVDDNGTPKVLKVLISEEPKAVELFQREAEVLKQLNHPGIPKVEPDGYFTSQPEGATDPSHCLVMELIEGQDLERWLAQRNNTPITQEEAIDWLKQLVNILAQVHEQQYFHRDIKPSNIMLRPDGKLVLIDFGLVRRLTATFFPDLVSQEITRYGTLGYIAPEQFNGQAIPQSDFFALGRTFVYLLTGNSPREFQERYDEFKLKNNWRDSARQISPSLADLIDDLMARAPEDRPETQIILDRLIQLPLPIVPPTRPSTSPRPRINYISVVLPLITFVLGVASTQVFDWIKNGKNRTLCPKAIVEHQYISCGENKLVPAELKPRPEIDPEELIYTNNQGIGKKEAYTIAVAAPLNTSKKEHDNIGIEMLRGVAQAQHEVNNNGGINGKMLRVAIADDGGEVDQGKEIANALGAEDEILAVVGHYSSKLTTGVVEVYQQNKLVLISSSSTTVELSSVGDFFFRTVPNNRVIGMALSNYRKNTFNQQKAAVFYNSQSPYSKSIKNQFSTSGGRENVVSYFDFSEAGFNAKSAVAEAEKLGAKMLVLFPDVKNREKAREVIKANQGRYCMMAGATLYNPETLDKVGKEAENRLVVAIHWHAKDSRNTKFTQDAEVLWEGQVSWRTALAYDATRALIDALANTSQANRSSVEQALADPNFKTSGATEDISFQANGDRNEQIHALTTVVASGGGYKFVPINKAPSIDCDIP